MEHEVFEREAAGVASQLSAGHRLAIVGSTSFWHPESEATCTILGRLLADLEGLVLLTGGVAGVGEAVGRSFHAAGTHRGRGRLFHVLPRGHMRWDYGETIFAGSDMQERREVFGRLAEMYVVIEGGPGTAHETAVALARSGLLIPIGRSGGHSTDLYPRVARPSFASEQGWRTLASADASPKQVADAVTEIVRIYLRESTSRV